MFRVHRNVLTRDSVVFSNLFTRPSSDEKYDDLPVVEVYDDPLEMADFLDIIYNGVRCVVLRDLMGGSC